MGTVTFNFVWAHTALDSFKTCPREFWHKYVAKDLPKEKKSDAQLRGIAVHESFDLYLRAGRALPADLSAHASLLEGVKIASVGRTLEAEKRMGMTAEGTACEFFGACVWGRGAADVVIHGNNVGFLFDWKTGKKRDGDINELRRLALLVKVAYPRLNKILGAYGWLQTNEMGKVHDVSNFAGTYNEIKATCRTIEGMDPSKEWPANPSWKCEFCSVTKCSHNKT